MSKVSPDSPQRINAAISASKPSAQKILSKMSARALSTDDRLVKDWKWGAAFHYNGNICGIWGQIKHGRLISFKGAAMKDQDQLFTYLESPKALRTIKFYDVKDVDEGTLRKNIKQTLLAVERGQKGKSQKEDVNMPPIFMKVLDENIKFRKYFQSLSYYHRIKIAYYIGEVNRGETRQCRLTKVTGLLGENMELAK